MGSERSTVNKNVDIVESKYELTDTYTEGLEIYNPSRRNGTKRDGKKQSREIR